MNGPRFVVLPADNFPLPATMTAAMRSRLHPDPSKTEKPHGQLSVLDFSGINNVGIYHAAATGFSAFINIFFPDRAPLDPH